MWCTPKRASYIVNAVCLVAAVATLPEFFEFRSVQVAIDVDSDNLTSTSTPEYQLRVVQTDFGKSYVCSRVYKYANQAMFTFIPLVLLFVFNTLLVTAVLSAARRRQQMANTGRDVTAASDRQDRQRRGQQKITVS